ncbi:hypothetical protein RDI58_019785 [Solanum bulbocastanum]|uniref:DUF4218 domain-containing protein n=1 Tax=Solanum bulbocastanum TaxID=147425 RepID=A0AAN8Y7A5_SOLBU
MDTNAEEFDGSNQHNMCFDKKTEEFFRLLKEAERELYPRSKFLLCLKNYVRNRCYPEGAIAEGRWIDELMTLYSWHLDDVETKSNPSLRNDVLSNETTDQEGHQSSREKGFKLGDITHISYQMNHSSLLLKLNKCSMSIILWKRSGE